MSAYTDYRKNKTVTVICKKEANGSPFAYSEDIYYFNVGDKLDFWRYERPSGDTVYEVIDKPSMFIIKPDFEIYFDLLSEVREEKLDSLLGNA